MLIWALAIVGVVALFYVARTVLQRIMLGIVIGTLASLFMRHDR